MTIQLNVKLSEQLLASAQNYASQFGYMSMQELIRESLREKIFDDFEVREEYKKVLKSKAATTFIGKKASEKLFKELKVRVANERKKL